MRKNNRARFPIRTKAKLNLLAALALLSFATMAPSQVVTPVWVQHIAPWGTEGNGSNGVVLVNVDPTNQFNLLAGSRPEPNNNEDGSELQPVFTRLERYDANRMLLFIAENGINETDPNLPPDQIALAAAYPDRSAVWVDAHNGRNLGLAWYGGLHPAMNCIPPYNVTDAATGNQLAAYDPMFTFYFHAAIDEGAPGEKALYYGVNHLILRYAPLPDGSGWTNVPTIAYEENVPGIGDGLTDASGGNSGDNAQRWRWRNFRVMGSGTNTMIIGGGGTWRAGMHAQVLVTTNGLQFYPRGRIADRSDGIRNDYAGGGMGGRVVKYHTDPSHPNLEVYYQGHYPAYAYPSETPERYVSDQDQPWPGKPNVTSYNQQPWVAMFDSTPGITNSNSGLTNNLPVFQWQQAGKNGLPIDTSVDGIARYDGAWSMNTDAHQDLDYIVSYSSPSWNNAVPVRTYGWVAVHRLDGSIPGGQGYAYQIPLTEADVRVPGNGGDGLVGNEATYNGRVEVNPDTNAPANLKKAEITASFGPLGFGVFTVQNVAATIVTDLQDMTVLAGTTNTISAVTAGSPNTYQWYKDGVPLSDTKYLAGSHNNSYGQPVLTLREVIKSDAGTYQCKITNPVSGSTWTKAMKLTVAGAYVRSHQNAALFGEASQISTYQNAFAWLAIDGNTNQTWGGGSIAHTEGTTNSPIWWEVDLKTSMTIGRVVYFPRNDCCNDRQVEVNVVILDAFRNEISRTNLTFWGFDMVSPFPVDYAPPPTARFVRIERFPAGTPDPVTGIPSDAFLNIAEVQVFTYFRPTMDIGIYNGQIMVAWDRDAFSTPKLQQANSLQGPWSDVTTESPYTEPISGSAKFFKIVQGP
jgi:Immunoglobulin I-set domain